tara:strand:+ start:737 stop:967 length:231 start_codon:yes stop_codon:yes gene_type:complete
MRNTQFGIPITIIRGGMRAIRIDKLNPMAPMVPIAQITAIVTTVRQIATTLKDLKKRYSKIPVTSIDAAMNRNISF